MDREQGERSATEDVDDLALPSVILLEWLAPVRRTRSRTRDAGQRGSSVSSLRAGTPTPRFGSDYGGRANVVDWPLENTIARR
jgi:hypothetical protein